MIGHIHYVNKGVLVQNNKLSVNFISRGFKYLIFWIDNVESGSQKNYRNFSSKATQIKTAHFLLHPFILINIKSFRI